MVYVPQRRWRVWLLPWDLCKSRRGRFLLYPARVGGFAGELGGQRQTEDYAMARIIHLDGLTVPAPESATGDVVLRVFDDFLPEQAGIYRAIATDGQVTFTRYEKGAPQCEMDIRPLLEWSAGNLPPEVRPDGEGEKALFQMLPALPAFSLKSTDTPWFFALDMVY